MEIEVDLADFDDDEIIEYAKELMEDGGGEVTDEWLEWLIGYLHDIKKNNYALWFTRWEPELRKLLEGDY